MSDETANNGGPVTRETLTRDWRILRRLEHMQRKRSLEEHVARYRAHNVLVTELQNRWNLEALGRMVNLDAAARMGE